VAFSPIYGNGLAGPWAVAVDGDDNVWVSNFASDRNGIVQICGANPKGWPPGKTMGDVISPPGGYVGGGMRKGRVVEPLARKKGWERKLRHQSRVEKLKAMPRVHEGRTLSDNDRQWMDW
jgi:hypothetical protein